MTAVPGHSGLPPLLCQTFSQCSGDRGESNYGFTALGKTEAHPVGLSLFLLSDFNYTMELLYLELGTDYKPPSDPNHFTTIVPPQDHILCTQKLREPFPTCKDSASVQSIKGNLMAF